MIKPDSTEPEVTRSVPETTPSRKARPMPAKYRGRCAACNGHVNVGTAVTYDPESRKVTHVRCV